MAEVDAALAALAAEAWDDLDTSLQRMVSGTQAEDGGAVEARQRDLVPLLVRALDSPASRPAIELLRLIAEAPWGPQALRELGAVSAMCGRLRPFSLSPIAPSDVPLGVCAVLALISRSAQGRRATMRAAIPALSCMLLPEMDAHVELQSEAALALANLASSQGARHLMRGEHIVAHTVRRLGMLTSSPGTTDVLQAGLLSRLLHLLSHMAHDPTLAAQMLESGLVTPLLSVLKEPPRLETPPSEEPPPPEGDGTGNGDSAKPPAENAKPTSDKGKPSAEKAKASDKTKATEKTKATDKPKAAEKPKAASKPKEKKKTKQEIEAEAQAAAAQLRDSLQARLEAISGAATTVAVCAASSNAWRVQLRKAGTLRVLADVLLRAGSAFGISSMPSPSPGVEEVVVKLESEPVAPADDGNPGLDLKAQLEALLVSQEMELPQLSIGRNCIVALANCLNSLAPHELQDLCMLIRPLMDWLSLPPPPPIETAPAVKGSKAKGKADAQAELAAEASMLALAERKSARETAQAAAALCLSVLSGYGGPHHGEDGNAVLEGLCTPASFELFQSLLDAQLSSARTAAARILCNCSVSERTRDLLVADGGTTILKFVQLLDATETDPALRVALSDTLATLGVDSRVRRLLRLLPSDFGPDIVPPQKEIKEVAQEAPEEPPAGKSGGKASKKKGNADVEQPKVLSAAQIAQQARLSQRGVLWIKLSVAGTPMRAAEFNVAAGPDRTQRSPTLFEGASHVKLSLQGKLSDFTSNPFVLTAFEPLDKAAQYPLGSASVHLTSLRYVDLATFSETLRDDKDVYFCDVTCSVSWEPLVVDSRSGLQVLLASTYEHSTTEVRVASCTALASCITDLASAAAAVDSGAVERLTSIINDAADPIRACAAVCLDRLADWHPSFQLWLRGCIGVRMKTESGFINVGVGRSYLPRSIISSAGITRQHEVLLIDFESDKNMICYLKEIIQQLRKAIGSRPHDDVVDKQRVKASIDEPPVAPGSTADSDKLKATFATESTSSGEVKHANGGNKSETDADLSRGNEHGTKIRDGNPDASAQDDPTVPKAMISDESPEDEQLRLVRTRATDEEKVNVLARCVSNAMGGAMSYEDYMHAEFSWGIDEAKEIAGSDLVALGSISYGGARPRALLFKALADKIGLLCELHENRRVKGAHAHHAWVIAQPRSKHVQPANEEHGSRVLVDLVHSVGCCYAPDSADARRYMREGEYTYSTLAASAHQPPCQQKQRAPTQKFHPAHRMSEPIHTPLRAAWNSVDAM